jgi:PPOX class probable F420-dependent enzyme
VTITRANLLAFMRRHRYAALSSVHPDGSPQSAVVGVATSDRFEVVFDTLATSRKAQNLRRSPGAALVIGGFEPEAQRTVQLEGTADVPTEDDRDRLTRLYYDVFPDGRLRLSWPHLTYLRITPRWLRYSDFATDPAEVFEFDATSLRDLG